MITEFIKLSLNYKKVSLDFSINQRAFFYSISYIFSKNLHLLFRIKGHQKYPVFFPFFLVEEFKTTWQTPP